MKSKTPAINKFGFVGILFFVIGIIFACQYFVQGCLWWDCAPDRDFHVLEMELPSSIFPDGAQISPIQPSSEGAGEIERGSQSIFWGSGNGFAVYAINRYPTTKKANQVYELVHGHMADTETENLWARPTELTSLSSTADQLFVACSDWSGINQCGMLARYQEYEISFRAIMDDQMTYSDFEKIIVYIDEQISSHLYP